MLYYPFILCGAIVCSISAQLKKGLVIAPPAYILIKIAILKETHLFLWFVFMMSFCNKGHFHPQYQSNTTATTI